MEEDELEIKVVHLKVWGGGGKVELPETAEAKSWNWSCKEKGSWLNLCTVC
jgi:hypothetical protein